MYPAKLFVLLYFICFNIYLVIYLFIYFFPGNENSLLQTAWGLLPIHTSDFCSSLYLSRRVILALPFQLHRIKPYCGMQRNSKKKKDLGLCVSTEETDAGLIWMKSLLKRFSSSPSPINTCWSNSLYFLLPQQIYSALSRIWHLLLSCSASNLQYASNTIFDEQLVWLHFLTGLKGEASQGVASWTPSWHKHSHC